MSGFWQSMRERNRAGTALPADYAPPGGAAGAAGAADLSALAQRLFTSDVNVRNVRCFFSVHRAKSGLQITLPSKPRD